MVTESVISLLKKSIYDLLFLAHKFLALLQAVRLALNVNHSAVMQDTIQDCGGDRDIGEDLIPLGESFVGGKYCRGLFVSSGNELKEQVCALDIYRKIADFIDDEHPARRCDPKPPQC